MNDTSLAVVISTYNQPDFLQLTLNGYRQQTDNHFSLYIADDGSSNVTRDLIKNMQADFPVPIYHIWQADDGFRKARIHNKTIRRIREAYTLLTDGDCIPLPGLIAAHRFYASNSSFISGSRVLLSRSYTQRICQQTSFITMRSRTWWVTQRLGGHINRLLPLLLPIGLSPANKKLAGIRGCHLSLPTDALRKINGFDESFEGWGREDSDLVARLLHSGYRRKDLRGLPVLHLWHSEFSRHKLEKNDYMLQTCLQEQRIEARLGIKELNDQVDSYDC